MERKQVSTLLLAMAIVVVVIIGLVNFNLLVSILARVLVAVLLIGTVVFLVRSLFLEK